MISDRSRLTLHAHGLRRLLRRTNYISAPCGWERGAKRDHIRVGSGPDGVWERTEASADANGSFLEGRSQMEVLEIK